MGRRVHLGVIGAGRIGRLHAENLARRLPDAALRLVADPNLDAAHAIAASCGDVPAVADWRDMLAMPDIEAVVVCSPTDTHAAIVEAAAAAGKHIFCEKPLDLDIGRAAAAVTAAARAGVRLQIGFNRRFDPSFARVAAGVRRGEVGMPHMVRITSRDPQPPPATYVQGSGGLFLDMTIHDFDMARFVTGQEIVEVHAMAGSLVDPAIGAAGDVDTAAILLRFAGGALGCIDNSRRAVYGYDQRVEVFGSEGALVADHATPTTVQRWNGEGQTADRPHFFFLERYRDAYLAEMREFLLALQEQRDPSVGGRDGLQALRVAHAAQRSRFENRPVLVEAA
jgi:myo-inositol 2-dehydrogenase/D-chiro-inositol 1-dehydrogenase